MIQISVRFELPNGDSPPHNAIQGPRDFMFRAQCVHSQEEERPEVPPSLGVGKTRNQSTVESQTQKYLDSESAKSFKV